MSSITDRLRDMAGLLGEEAAELIEDNDRSYALLFAENARLKAEIAALSPQPQQAAPTCPKCGKRPESFCRAALIPCDATIKVEKWPELPEPQQAAVVPDTEFSKMLREDEGLEGAEEWLKQEELTVNVGDAIEAGHDVHLESTAGWLLRFVRACRAEVLRLSEGGQS